MSPESFIKRFLKDRLKCVSVCVGENFRFGKDRGTGVSGARELFKRHGIALRIIPMERSFGRVISSSTIKSALEKNDFAGAEKLLGRPYSIGGVVERGLGIGKEEFVPTANMDVSGERVLLSGVYACRVVIEGEKTAKRGVLSVGTNATLSRDKKQKVEVHIFRQTKRLYGKFIEVFPFRKMREEKTFKNKEDLRKAILQDIERVKHVFKRNLVQQGLLKNMNK